MTKKKSRWIEWRTIDKNLKPVLVCSDGTETDKVGWTPQPGSQEVFLGCTVREVLYEGTRGGGKTDCLIQDFAQFTGPDKRTRKEIEEGVPQRAGFGPEWRGILFRQTFPQLTDVIQKTRKWFPMMFPLARFNEGKTTWTFEHGETLRLSYGKKEGDYWNYHGHQYPWLAFEELTTWADPGFFKKMFSCCRSTVVPAELLSIRSTTNPYGPGHNWVKHRYKLPIRADRIVDTIIKGDDHDEAGKYIPEDQREPDRVAIHSYLDENKVLLSKDPHYKGNIRASARNPAELAAWLDGSWDIVAGGMFDDVWNAKKHIIKPFDIPNSWRVDRSFDWGSSRPFSVGWWAESDGSDVRLANGVWASTVRGDLFRIHEWYGWTGEPNQGLRLLAVDIAKGIIERELGWGIHERVRPGPADSAIYAAENGVSIGIDMSKTVVVEGKQYSGVHWVPADKRSGSRKAGWELIRKYLGAAVSVGGKPRENPGLFVFDRCTQFRRTLPVLPRDNDRDPDDVDTTAEDHIADEVRYRVRFAGQKIGTARVKGIPS